MSTKITLTVNGTAFAAELNDGPAAKEILGKLPLEISMSRWGDEYYGGAGLSTPVQDDARDTMEVGELAVWPPGKAFCIFFGPTPASSDDRPVAASDANPVGRMLDDSSPLKSMGSSVRVKLEKA